MYPTRLKTPTPPNNNQENEKIFGSQREIRPNTTNPPATSIGPLSQTLTPMLGQLTKLQKREKGLVPTKRFRDNISMKSNEAALN